MLKYILSDLEAANFEITIQLSEFLTFIAKKFALLGSEGVFVTIQDRLTCLDLPCWMKSCLEIVARVLIG